MTTLVLDTNVLVAALLRGGSSARAVVRACLQGHYLPVIGPALLAEYEDLTGRAELFEGSVLSRSEREAVLDALSKGLTAKFLHGPQQALHHADGDERARLAQLLPQLFRTKR